MSSDHGEATFAFDPSALELEPSPLDPAQVVEGTPRVAERVVWSSPDGRRARGVWEHGPGVSTDVEVDEVFVVVSGRATIEVEDGPTLEVGPGDVGISRPARGRPGASTRPCGRSSTSNCLPATGADRVVRSRPHAHVLADASTVPF